MDSRLVTRTNILEVLGKLADLPELGCDTETYGLRAFHGDRLFSIILADSETSAHYFNFKEYEGLDSEYVLQAHHLEAMKAIVFENRGPKRTWYFMNAKFDLHILANEGIHPVGEIHDVKVTERLLYNDYFRYDLAFIAAKKGFSKSNAVDAYIKKHKLVTKLTIPGKKTVEEKPHFDRVPLDVIVPYGLTDGTLPLLIGRKQVLELKLLDTTLEPHPKLWPLHENEKRLTRVVTDMERRGVLVDKGYCEKAILHEQTRMERAAEAFRHATGIPFEDKVTVFAKALPTPTKLTKGGKDGQNKKPCYDADSLEILAATSPEAQLILDFRDAKKRLDFYHGFLYHADGSGFIHSNLDQAGTKTGRFSSSQPNLQQLNKEEGGDEGAFPVRRAIIPPPDHFFGMLDFSQQEYRLMLDMAGAYSTERSLIKAVLGGLDVHEATAQSAKIGRQAAKTVNFSILFGAGLDLLAARLRVPTEEARRIKSSVLDASPEIRVFLRRVSDKARERGYITNWFGRRWYCPNEDFAFRGPNFICQGGGADIIKVAMVQIDEFLQKNALKSYIALQIHDEIVMAVHKSERDVMVECKKIMEAVYPYRYLPLTVGAEYSERSLVDKLAFTV